MSDGQRIGDSDREAAVADLRTHAAAGRISSKEYEERSLKVGQASTWADLTDLFSDLPEPRPRSGGQPLPPAPPYGTDAPPVPPYGTGAPPAPSYGSYGSGSPTGYGAPPAPSGGNRGPVGPPTWGGGPFGNGGTPALRRLLPVLPIILIAVMVLTHAWFLVFLFPVAGALFGRSQKQYRGNRGNRRGRRRYY